MNEEHNVVIDPFTGQPRIEVVKKEIHTSSGLRGETGAKGDKGDTGATGADGIVPDVAFTRTTGNVLRDGFGGNINLGTNGDMIFNYARHGRLVYLYIQIWAASDWSSPSGGFFQINQADLPYEPKALETAPAGIGVGNAWANGFGYISYDPAQAVEACPPAVAQTGGGKGIVFIVIRNNLSGGTGNLLSGTNPNAIGANDWQYTGLAIYQAASAA